MRIITKYANRKLYDYESNSYMSLDEVLSLTPGSYRIYDKETGLDITLNTLVAALNENVDDLYSNRTVRALQYILDEISDEQIEEYDVYKGSSL